MHPLDFFHPGNAAYLEQLQAEYERDPSSLDPQWRIFFTGFEAGASQRVAAAAELAGRPADLTYQVYDLVHSYRELGHCIAQVDPLGRRHQFQPLLELSEVGLSPADLDRPAGDSGFLGPGASTIQDLLDQLRATYCRTLGVEYMEITDKAQRQWLQERIEPILNRPEFSPSDCRRILESLIAAETFETFLNTKFLGQKRFSVEGAESLIPLLDTLVEDAAGLDAEQVVIGMAHRGRLNVLAHTVGKPYEIILSEFLGNAAATEGEGDVKYHLGYSHDRQTASGKMIHVSLSANPSHLELVNPVIEGMVRAKQERLGDVDHSRVVPILIHGEAAFTGQGSVPETLGLSELPAYRTGGTIHVIVNNQIGFTAPPTQTRFTPYPTDVAKMIQAPIFHVNGDDPEAVVHAARLAIAFRQQFKVDVMIDLWCFRKHGHNETDDPTYTQPMMYREIAKHKPVAQLYIERLTEAGKLTAADAEQIKAAVRGRLDEALTTAKERHPRQRITTLGGWWEGFTRAGNDWSAETAVPQNVLRQITDVAVRTPDDFHVHPKLKKLLENRAAMAQGEKPIDWGCAEMWAMGSLLLEGTSVRLTGQDCERGTFSHRHAVLHDSERATRFIPLQSLAEQQGKFTVINSMLSELGVLGFEYGYSSADPNTLVIWEAQFGDFANGAQPIIDQFIVSGESKWQRFTGLVMLLPHGYEGQGPEHSSARLERFLQLCAEDNVQVCYPTHPAQYFHMLRRQMRRKFRKPLIVMSPKSLLRDERSTSSIEDFTQGGVKLVLDDPAQPDPTRVQRVLLCSGHVYFTLEAPRRERSLDEVAILRVEQLYPFPKRELLEVVARYKHAREWCWVQEEPRNMGAWHFVEAYLRELLPPGGELSCVSRKASASTAAGSHRLHEAQEKSLIEKALGAAAVERAPHVERMPQPTGNGAAATAH
jgi:2-oxoglutarate dehydrogenase E1 component